MHTRRHAHSSLSGGQNRVPLQREPHFKMCPDPFWHRFRGGLQTRTRSVAQINSRWSGSHIWKVARIHFCIVSGGGSPNQHDVGGQNIILLELEPHLERRPDQFWRCFVGGWGGGAPNKNEIHGQHRLPLQRQPHFERCPDPFLHRFRGEGLQTSGYTCIRVHRDAMVTDRIQIIILMAYSHLQVFAS